MDDTRTIVAALVVSFAVIYYAAFLLHLDLMEILEAMKSKKGGEG
jgi:hypothetical protein